VGIAFTVNKEERRRSMAAEVQATFESSPTDASVYACEPSLDEAQRYRAGAYRLLAALLRSAPDREILDQVSMLGEVDAGIDELAVSMSMLGLAAGHCNIEAISDEFHRLFIGIGRGELVPYGSWYLTGFLMEKPLGILRDDLAILGFERADDVSEPEDHIAALSEVMSLLIEEGLETGVDPVHEPLQKEFFEKHIAPWADRFFVDLSESPSAIFYRSVGRFGLDFIAFEKRYFSMSI
jgi:TorA maturation chaperone TorD